MFAFLQTKFFLLMSTIILASFVTLPHTDGAITLASVLPGLLTAGASLIGTTVTTLSNQGPNRNVVIEINNYMSHDIYGGQYFLYWGHNAIPPTSIIKKETREAMRFEKAQDTATGTTGVLTYNIGSGVNYEDVRIALTFSVPYNYLHASNWFGIKFIHPFENVDQSLYNHMYYDPAWSNPTQYSSYGYAQSGSPISIFYKDYIVSASMSNVGRSVIKINILRRPGGYQANRYMFHGK